MSAWIVVVVFVLRGIGGQDVSSGHYPRCIAVVARRLSINPAAKTMAAPTIRDTRRRNPVVGVAELGTQRGQ